MVKQNLADECVNILASIRLDRMTNEQLKATIQGLDISQSTFIVAIPAEIVEQYVDNSTETLNFDLIAAPEGIFIEIEEVRHKKHWQTKPLTRLCGMMRAAIALLGALRELRDWL